MLFVSAKRLCIFVFKYGLIPFYSATGRSEAAWVQVAITPGLLLQKLTTREPSDDQLEVAIKALEAVRPVA